MIKMVTKNVTRDKLKVCNNDDNDDDDDHGEDNVKQIEYLRELGFPPQPDFLGCREGFQQQWVVKILTKPG